MITVSTLTATATGNTVNYSGGNQTGISTIYNNLTISGTNTKTFATTPTVTGTLSMEGTASIVVTTGAVTYGSNATLQYNKATNYTATTEEWPATFAGTGGVKILNTGVITFGARKRVIYNLSIATTAKVNLGTLKTHTAGSLTLGGANSCGTWGYGPGTPPVNKNQTYFANTTGYITVSSPVPDFSGSVTNATCPSSADGAIDLDEGIEAGVGFDNTSGSFIDLNTPFLNNLSGFTLEGWINIDLADITGDRVGSLFGQNDAIEFGFYDANSIQCWTAGGGSVNISSTNYPNDGNWHHIAAVGNGTNITIYMDGVAVGSPGGTTTTNYGSSAYSAKIGGGVWDESGGSLTGPILKTGFWNRPLSATEIANLASGYYTYIGTESGLIAGYNLDEASGETVTPVPYSVNNNGSFVNTPVWVNIYNYLWRKSGDPLFTATTKDISGLNPGTYEVTVSNTCYSLSKSFTVTNLYPNLSAVSLSPSSNQTICHNGTGSAVAVTETGGGPITARQWGKRLVSGGAITAITGETAATYTPTAIDLGTGSWFLVCTSTPTCGAPIVSNEVPVTVYPDFSLGTIPSTGETLCSGSNPSIISGGTDATGGDGNITYKWQANGVDIASSNTATYDPPSGISTTTTYTRWVKDGYCNTSFTQSTGEWVVVVNPSPSISSHPAALTLCAGGSGSFSVATSASSPTYQWQYSIPSDPTNWQSIPNTAGVIAGATTNNLQVLAADVSWTGYNVSCLVTSNGCSTRSNSVLFTVYALPTTSNAGSDQSNCNSGTFTLSGNAPTIGTGAWSLVSGTATITTPSSRTSTVTGIPAGSSATLRWSISNGTCTASTDDVVLTNNLTSTIILTNGAQNQTVCSGSAIATTIYTFAGSATNASVSGLPSGLTSNVNTTNKTVTISGTPTASGTYTITTSGHTAPCTAATIGGTINVNASPATPTGIAVDASPVCSGTAVALLVNAPGAGLTTDWYTGSCGGTLIGTGNSITVTPAVTTTYYARTRNMATGCVSALCAHVSVAVVETPTITLGTMPSICVNTGTAQIPYSATTGSPTNYSINYDSAAEAKGFTDISNYAITPGSLTMIIPNGGWGIPTGTYYGELTVQTNSPIACISVSYPISVTITSSGAITTNVTPSKNPVCEGTPVTYSATPDNASSYRWYVNGTYIAGETGATYTYTPVNGDIVRCAALVECYTSYENYNSVTVVVLPEPAAAVASNNSPVCAGDNVQFILNGTAGATVTYNINGGANVATTLTGGTATITVTGATANQTLNLVSVANPGCTIPLTGSSMVTVHPLPNPGPIIPD